jgi:small subunit ribosomal protein S11
MGKKKIVKQTTEEALKEGQAIEKAIDKNRSVKTNKTLKRAVVYINSSYNNTLVGLCDSQGNVLASKSAGVLGFKGSKKATSYAASKVADAIAEIIQQLKIEDVEVIIKGLGSGREAAVRSLGARGVEITSIKDKTPVPHGGCRPPKPRRV